LSYHINNAANPDGQTQVDTVVEVLPNGPLLVHGTLKVKNVNGNETLKSETTAFCRCGASKSKPYCDGSHHKIGFED
jgi:Iron-binding zinc finger CDGSH type